MDAAEVRAETDVLLHGRIEVGQVQVKTGGKVRLNKTARYLDLCKCAQMRCSF